MIEFLAYAGAFIAVAVVFCAVVAAVCVAYGRFKKWPDNVARLERKRRRKVGKRLDRIAAEEAELDFGSQCKRVAEREVECFDYKARDRRAMVRDGNMRDYIAKYRHSPVQSVLKHSSNYSGKLNGP